MPAVPPGRSADATVILLAPNAFKGSLTARQAASAMADGVRRAVPTARCVELPMADGGDGSLDALESAGFARRPVTTRGPTGRSVSSSYVVRDTLAVVELAAACGMALLPAGAFEPMSSSTAGLGDAIRAALAEDVDEVVVCLGGSASTDGGTGMLAALGALLRDTDNVPRQGSGTDLSAIATLDLSPLDPRAASVRFTIATDVTSPLLGPTGAAAVFGPQKGATPEQVLLLDAGLSSWSDVLARATGVDAAATAGAGAAGGTAAACIAALHGRIVPGAAFIEAALGLAEAIAGADLVVTGEGRLDAQTLLGKGIGAVAQRASAAGVPVIAVCGQVVLDEAGLAEAGIDACVSLADGLDAAVDPMHDAWPLLRDATARAVASWLGGTT